MIFRWKVKEKVKQRLLIADEKVFCIDKQKSLFTEEQKRAATNVFFFLVFQDRLFLRERVKFFF